MIEGYLDNAIHYHLFVMHDAGLMSNSQGPDLCVRRMTLAGHEFLEAARDGEWRKAVTAQMTQAGGFFFSIAKKVLVDVVGRQVGLIGGNSAP